MPDFRSLQMNSVVIHSIPSVRRADRAKAPGPELSDIPVALSTAGEKYLTERLIGALLKARPVKEQDPPNSPVPEQVRRTHADPTKLVEQSRAMAAHLYTVESGRNSAGLMMAVYCDIAGEQWIVVSKIEHEQGVQVEVEVNQAGERTFNLTYLDNLIFAETTKVYKIAAFPASTSHAGNRIAGHAADPQNGRNISDVWLYDFLGCEYVERPDVLTERFYDGITKAVSRVAALDAASAAQVEIALLAEMNKAATTINPNQFITQNVPPEHQDAFAQQLTSDGVTLQPIPKDTANIATKILRVKIDTTRDATVLVPPAMFDDDSFQFLAGSDGKSRLVVTDTIRNITGANASAGRKALADATSNYVASKDAIPAAPNTLVSAQESAPGAEG